MHTHKTAMTTNYRYVAVRLAGVDDFEDAHANKPNRYETRYDENSETEMACILPQLSIQLAQDQSR
jgi:hypothetical protein